MATRVLFKKYGKGGLNLATLTVFTPTYNRAYILNQCYESLVRQTSKDFIWLIIDDGSTDDTRKLVEEWMKKDNSFEIRYYYKQNGGMHTGHNAAYELIDTELNVCIDSDDYMPNDAVEKIINFWENNEIDKDIAGFIGLDAYGDGSIIGDSFPETLRKTTLFEINNKYKIQGDKKIVYRSEVSKKYPYPLYKDEKYVGLAYKYYKIDEDYKLLTMNEVLCIVEYMEDGSSLNMFSQYLKNPKGFAFYRIENMKNSRATFSFKFKENIHYVSSSLISKNKTFIKESPCKGLTILSLPFGYLLYKFIIYKNAV